MIVSEEIPLVESKYYPVDGTPVLDVLHTINEERDNSSYGTKEETENGSQDKCRVSVLVVNVGCYLVALGASGDNWSWSKHNLEQKMQCSAKRNSHATEPFTELCKHQHTFYMHT